MMTTTTFDTLKFAKRLKEAGVPVAEAEAISEAFKEVQGELELVTKQDLAFWEISLKSEMKQLEHRMAIKLGSMMVIAIGVVATIVKLIG